MVTAPSLLDRFWRNLSASIRVNAAVKSALRPRPHKRLSSLYYSPQTPTPHRHQAAQIASANPTVSGELTFKFRPPLPAPLLPEHTSLLAISSCNFQCLSLARACSAASTSSSTERRRRPLQL